MIAVSDAVKAKINNGDIPYMRMQLITASGRTVWLEDGQFWSDGVSFAEATSSDSQFDVGSAVIGSFNFIINNFNHTFDDVPLWGGTVAIPLVYYMVDNVRQYIPKGVYYISDHRTSGNVIRCTSYDGMKLLDQTSTTITYPITAQALVQALCTANNITASLSNMRNASMTINEPTETESSEEVVTDRQLLAYVCQITGNFARMNENGELYVGWYDFSNPIDLVSTFDGKDLWTNEIEVTGIEVTYRSNGSAPILSTYVSPSGELIYIHSDNVTDSFSINSDGELIATADADYSINSNGELIRVGEMPSASDESTENTSDVTFLYGSNDFVIKLTNNPFINDSNVMAICRDLLALVRAYNFRPGSLPVLSNPCLQAGDVLRVTDNIRGTQYLFPVTSLTYTKNLVENIRCAFEEQDNADLRKSADYTLRASVRQAIDQAKTADEIARVASEAAEKSGYQLLITSNRGNTTYGATDIVLSALIYDRDMNVIDPSGLQYLYRWWVMQDSSTARYLDGGKNITVRVADALCDYTADIYYETMPYELGVLPFTLCNRNGELLTNRAGSKLTARAGGE